MVNMADSCNLPIELELLRKIFKWMATLGEQIYLRYNSDDFARQADIWKKKVTIHLKFN